MIRFADENNISFALFREEKIESCVSPEREVRTFNNDTTIAKFRAKGSVLPELKCEVCKTHRISHQGLTSPPAHETFVGPRTEVPGQKSTKPIRRGAREIYSPKALFLWL